MNNNIKINMPINVRFIIDKLYEHSKPTYIVGGCVRDAILGIEPKDWDICTQAHPDEIIKILKPGIYNFENNEIHIKNIIPTGIKYGTITFNINDELYEITTFRKETGYSDNRHPDKIIYADDIFSDLARRDFTCNSMAYNNFNGLIDPYNGYYHIQSKILCSTGSANDRFKEDALRILRAIRFASKYNWQLTADMHTSILDCYNSIATISKERIRDELCKILQCEYCDSFLWKYSEIIALIIPELKNCIGFEQHNPYHEYDVYTHMLKTIKNCPSKDIITRFALFLHDIGKPQCAIKDEKDPTRLHFYGHGEVSAHIAKKVVSDLKFDNDTKHKIEELVLHHDTQFTVSERFIRKWLNKIGPEQFERLLDVRESDIKGQRKEFYNERLEKIRNMRKLYQEMMTKEQCFNLKDLNIKGNDLIALGIKKGPIIGQILNELLEKVINEELENDQEILINYVKQHKLQE